MERNPHLVLEGAGYRLLRHRREDRLHLHPRRVLSPAPAVLEGAIADARAARLPGAEHPRQRASTARSTCTAAPARTRRAKSRRCSSRSRASARSRAAAAVPGGGRPVRLPDRHQQRRDAVQRAAHHDHGPEWFAALGPEKNGGPKLFCVSGHVKRPGVVRGVDEGDAAELIDDYAGGMRDGRRAEGGHPRRFLDADPAARSDRRAGQLRRRRVGGLDARLGGHHGAWTTPPCMVWLAENLLHFYRHESCGKCTPCREGTDWMLPSAPPDRSTARRRCKRHRPAAERGANINGKTLCAFGDAAVTPVLSTLKLFRHEYEAHIRERALPAAGGLEARRMIPVYVAPARHGPLAVFVMLLLSAAVMVYSERKVAAFIQQRLRPLPGRAEGPASADRRRASS